MEIGRANRATVGAGSRMSLARIRIGNPIVIKVNGSSPTVDGIGTHITPGVGLRFIMVVGGAAPNPAGNGNRDAHGHHLG